MPAIVPPARGAQPNHAWVRSRTERRADGADLKPTHLQAGNQWKVLDHPTNSSVLTLAAQPNQVQA
ncbi:hypothetical protein, partial [Massilia phosphatilytica]